MSLLKPPPQLKNPAYANGLPCILPTHYQTSAAELQKVFLSLFESKVDCAEVRELPKARRKLMKLLNIISTVLLRKSKMHSKSH